MLPRYLVNFNLSELETQTSDFLIIGGGVAGLFTALKAASLGEVTVITKLSLEECNTSYAQGGIASVMGEDDSTILHMEDTLEAGAGICNQRAVQILVEEGPARVRELMEMGVEFDRTNQHYALGREGAHSRDRVLHVGDCTGRAIQKVLMDSVKSCDHLNIKENLYVIDLLTDRGRCVGALVFNPEKERIEAYLSKTVVMATGGMGNLFERNTNSDVATGDGTAMAYRAGAEVMDLEFFQFHPTVFYTPEGKAFLISEAVRGAGGILRNEEEEQFMIQYHPLADLGPRDVVTRAMVSVMRKTKTKSIYLDLRHMGEDYIKRRFPNIYCTLKDYNIDITKDLIPVVPASHYTMGGVKTDVNGETNIKGLFVTGEAACNGVNGANRLASNSLLEGLVFGDRVVRKARSETGFSFNSSSVKIQAWEAGDSAGIEISGTRDMLRKVMFGRVGIIRSYESLDAALQFINQQEPLFRHNVLQKESFELKNMLIAAELMAKAALMRKESRGGHFRQDFPAQNNKWRGHLVFSLSKERKEEVNWIGTMW